MIYLDTGCLVKLYYPEPESARVAKFLANAQAAFTPLHRLELSNALSLKIFRKEAANAHVEATLREVNADIEAGVLLPRDLDWSAAFAEAAVAARAHSPKMGTRSLDILHCVAARLLGVDLFVTTDERQRKLAQKLGLRCPAV